MKNRLLSVFLVFLVSTFLWSSNLLSQTKVGDNESDNNGYLKILKIEKHKSSDTSPRGPKKPLHPQLEESLEETVLIDISGFPYDYVKVLVQVLRELREGEPHKICIHYWDSNGEPLPGESQYTEKGLAVGEIRSVIFEVPSGAKSFEVWLPKVK